MSQILAVYLQKKAICCARFQFERDEPAKLISAFNGERPYFRHEVIDEEEKEIFHENEALRSYLAESIDDEVVGLFDSESLISERLELPFSDRAKLAQVIPLQLEEELPFETDGYLLDFVTGSEGEALVVGIKEKEIAETLAVLKQLKLDPSILAPGVVGLAALLQGQESAAAITVTGGRFLFSYSGSGAVRALREKRVNGDEDALEEVFPSLLYVAKELKSTPSKVLTFGKKIRLPLSDLSTELITLPNYSGRDLVTEELLLFGLSRARFEKKVTINFRKGAFRYRGNFKHYLSPLLSEAPSLILLLCCAGLWFFSVMYAEASKQSLIDSRFQEALAPIFPGETIPYKGEVAFVEGKVAELESRLKGLGSVSSLSPLEAFRELSTIIGPNVDIAIDSISLTPIGVTFGGSVADNGTVGRLIGILEKKKDRFCGVKVDPRGSVPGGNRVRIVSELKYCQ